MERSSTPLFRKEAVEAQRPQAYGRAILVRPITFSVLTSVAVAIAGVIVGYFVWGTYTEHVTLRGQLLPDRGVIKVHPAQFGTVVEKHVSEGDSVARGDALFVISSERFSSAMGPTKGLVGRELERQQAILEQAIERAQAHESAELESLERTEAALKEEMRNLDAMLESQRERLALAEEAVERYSIVQDRGFVPEDRLIAERDNYLQQRSQLQSLERERAAVERQLTELKNNARNLPFRYDNELADLERALASVRRDLTENEAQRLVTVTTPTSGTAAVVGAQIGQFVDTSRPLLSIVPDDSELEAHVYAPSNAIGFIEPGDKVLLRYEAYPYQRFGHHESTVEAVSRTAVSPAELASAAVARGVPEAQGGEPLYKVTLALSSQTITAYGEQHELEVGMAVEADVLQDTRRLYEWILEPLYSLTGRIH